MFRTGIWTVALVALLSGLVACPSAQVRAQDTAAASLPAAPSAELSGQRVFTAGHSFHVFVPNILNDLCRRAGVKDPTQVGVQSIGGSRVIQHWELAEERNKLNPALATGKIYVLTLSPIYLPDAGIENIARFALEHNPDIRITLQEFWLPYDVYDANYQRRRPAAPDRDNGSLETLRAAHDEYFRTIDNEVRTLNEKLGRPVLFVVPAGQAMLALREKIAAGEAPGLKAQSDLFTDAIGHVRPPAQILVAYCQFAVTYRRSPVGLPLPAALEKAMPDRETAEALNRLLQQLAWEAAVQHPLAGVNASSGGEAATLGGRDPAR